MRKVIVSLILEYQGKILGEKRQKSRSTSPGTVILPAGHVEEGETNEQAICREMEEELGIKIHNPQLVHTADFDCEEKQRILWYKCESWEGNIQNNEAEELVWVDPSELHRFTHQVTKDAISAYLRSK